MRRNRTRWLPFSSAFGALVVAALAATSGVANAEKDYDNWKHMDVPPAPALSPEAEKDTFRIAPGFKVELAAAEPEVVDPVVLRWGPAGRMWVVEMRGYMPNVEGEGEQKPVGEIAVLEDKNGDGYFESRTTYLDGLVMPRALALVEGGVLVAEPPNLWYCQDTDGDLKCDTKTKVLNYGKQGPVEHTENGLRRAIDNWFYNAKSKRRFRFDLKDGKPKLTVDDTRFRGQWGIAQDSFGQLYYNYNSHYLNVDTYPSQPRPMHSPKADELDQTQGVNSDEAVHSIRVNPGINRGYKSKMLRDDGRLKRTTSVSGQMIYRGDQFPASFRGDAFVPEPAGNVLAYFDVSREDGKIHGQHTTFDDSEWGQREFLASRDERFRPVNVENGPDGAMYVVDLYRGILQHKAYITKKYLKPQILARGLDKPVGLGRIWRVVSTKQQRRDTRPDLTEKTAGQLVQLLGHDNAWHRDWAQRLLIRREATSVASKLRELAVNSDNQLARIHAIWTLQGLDQLNDRVISEALESSHKQVRLAAARARADPQPKPIDYESLEDGIVEAEAAQTILSATTDSGHEGYTGSGYVDFQSKASDIVRWQLENVPAGEYKLVFRYAMKGEARPLKLVVNGETVVEKLALEDTNGWAKYREQAVSADLKEGKNKIQLEAIGQSGPNLDHVKLVPKK